MSSHAFDAPTAVTCAQVPAATPARTDADEAAVWVALGEIAGPRHAARCLPNAGDQLPAPLTWDALWATLAADGWPLWSVEETAAIVRRSRDAVRQAAKQGIRILGWSSVDYPPALRRIACPPPVLWLEGTLPADRPAVAIVGARAASRAATVLASDLARDLAAAGLVVVSGLALGVDGGAHEGALRSGSTVAVLGTGIDVCYPARHRDLSRRIAGQGALVTEFRPGTPPLPMHFPRRNRLVAGLSVGVVVVEAGERSGALITAQAALEQGREVMVVPGLATAGRNRGGHALIKDGAALVEDARDVLDVLRAGPLRTWTPTAVRAVSTDAASADGPEWLGRLFREWRRGEELDLDEIAALSEEVPERVLPALIECELTGAVARASSGRFVRL